MKVITDAVSLTVSRATFGAEGVGAETVTIAFESQTPVTHGEWVEVDGHRGIVVQPEKNYVQWPYNVVALDPVSAKLKDSFVVPGAVVGGRDGLYVIPIMQNLIIACGSSMTYDTTSSLRYYYLPEEAPYEWDVFLKQALQIMGAKLAYDTYTGTYNLTTALKTVALNTLDPSDVALSVAYDKYANRVTARIEADWIDQNALEPIVTETFENEYQRVEVTRRGEQLLHLLEDSGGGIGGLGGGYTREETYIYDDKGFQISAITEEQSGTGIGSTRAKRTFTASDVVSDVQYRFSSVERNEEFRVDRKTGLLDWVIISRTDKDGIRNADGSGTYKEDIYGNNFELIEVGPPPHSSDNVFRVLESNTVRVPPEIPYVTQRPRVKSSKLIYDMQPTGGGNYIGTWMLLPTAPSSSVSMTDIPALTQNIPYLRCESRFEIVAQDDISIGLIGVVDSEISAQWIMTENDMKLLARAELIRCAKCATLRATTLQIDPTITVGDVVTFEGREYNVTSVSFSPQSGTTIQAVGLLRTDEVARLRSFVMSNTGWTILKAIKKASKQVDNVRMGTITQTIDGKSAMVSVEGVGTIYCSNYGGGGLRTGDRVMLARSTGRGGTR